MYDADAPSSRLVIDQLDKPNVRGRLRAIALWSTESEAVAEDLLQDALLRALDPEDAPWVPAKGTFLTHMSFLMRQTWYRTMRRAAAQSEVLDNGVARDKTTPSPGPAADEEVARLRSVALWRSLLDQVLATVGDKHPIARRICELAMEGKEEPEEQAQSIGCTPEEVYAGLKLLKRHARRALEDWNAAEERRMKDLQQASARPPTEETP
jgi:DNA-directed RNA polymerase specialized sigma24 family protein